jgi:hypothetical protein
VLLPPLSARKDGYHSVIGSSEVDMALTVQHLQANLDAANQALANPKKHYRHFTGRRALLSQRIEFGVLFLKFLLGNPELFQ